MSAPVDGNRPLDEDPDFLAGLAELEEGLDPVTKAHPFETSAFAQPAAVPTGSRSVPAATPGGPRPLLELFPPAPAPGTAAPGPAIESAGPPQLVPSRPPTTRTTGNVSGAPSSHEIFYGLDEKPFGLSPDSRFIYRSSSYERVAQELINAVRRSEGLLLLTGEAGTGKTTLCRTLAEQLGRRTVTAFIGGEVRSVDDVLKAALVEFGVVSREDAARGRLATAGHSELADAVGDFAASLTPLQASALIVVDDAHRLPIEALDRVCALSAPAADDRRVQVLLVGEPALASLLRHDELRPFARRIAVRCRLDPLLPDEVGAYVAHRLAIASSSARVRFNDGAARELHALTGGLPRLVNLVCDRALARGADASAGVITASMVASAAVGLGLVQATSRLVSIVSAALLIVACGGLMLAGAAAAIWIFRDDVSRAIAEWQRVPPPPGGPVLRRSPPLAPVPPPEEEGSPGAQGARGAPGSAGSRRSQGSPESSEPRP